MKYVQRPWLTLVPWTQFLGLDGYAWTVLPSWPPYEKRIIRPGRAEQIFRPTPADMATVIEPDEPEALATLAATFGRPDILAFRPSAAEWWRCPEQVAATVLAHLRDFHGTLDLGSPSYRHTRDDAEALAYHWQLHQQQLMFPLPVPHTH